MEYLKSALNPLFFKASLYSDFALLNPQSLLEGLSKGGLINYEYKEAYRLTFYISIGIYACIYHIVDVKGKTVFLNSSLVFTLFPQNNSLH